MSVERLAEALSAFSNAKLSAGDHRLTPEYAELCAAWDEDSQVEWRWRAMAETFAIRDADFLAHLTVGAGCWLWTGALIRGYGSLTRHVDGKRWAWLAQRYALYLASGVRLDSSVLVCHRCDEPRCVRPDHLFIGSQKQNIADMCAKGRHRVQQQKWKQRHMETLRLVSERGIAS